MQLPDSVFERRLQNERQLLTQSGKLVKASPDSRQFEVQISGPGLQQVASATAGSAKTIQPITLHRVRIDIARGFPYPGGFDVTWLTPIFHPNIRPTDGKVCIRILSQWSPSNTLLSLVDGMERLLKEPNPNDPLNIDAARYYTNLQVGKKIGATTPTPAKPVSSGPRVVNP